MSIPLKQRQVKTGKPSKPDAMPRLPHERDESEDSQASTPRPDMEQAYEDIERGLVDTDLRGSLGVDEATRARHNKLGKTPPAPGRSLDPNRKKLPGGK